MRQGKLRILTALMMVLTGIMGLCAAISGSEWGFVIALILALIAFLAFLSYMFAVSP